MRLRFLLSTTIVLLLTGCMSTEVLRYGKINQSEKTITVPSGGRLLVGAIKTELQKSGWTIVIDRGPTVIRGKLGEIADLETGGTFRTRYRLEVNQNQVDYCITGGAALVYDLALIDNKTGSEIFTMSGRDCQPRIVNRFMSAVHDGA